MARENRTIQLAERPQGNIELGKTFKLEKTPAPTTDQLKDGEILVEALYLSLDPAMRGWLNGTFVTTFWWDLVASIPETHSASVFQGIMCDFGLRERDRAEKCSHALLQVSDQPIRYSNR